MPDAKGEKFAAPPKIVGPLTTARKLPVTEIPFGFGGGSIQKVAWNLSGEARDQIMLVTVGYDTDPTTSESKWDLSEPPSSSNFLPREWLEGPDWSPATAVSLDPAPDQQYSWNAGDMNLITWAVNRCVVFVLTPMDARDGTPQVRAVHRWVTDACSG